MQNCQEQSAAPDQGVRGLRQLLTIDLDFLPCELQAEASTKMITRHLQLDAHQEPQPRHRGESDP